MHSYRAGLSALLNFLSTWWRCKAIITHRHRSSVNFGYSNAYCISCIKKLAHKGYPPWKQRYSTNYSQYNTLSCSRRTETLLLPLSSFSCSLKLTKYQRIHKSLYFKTDIYKRCKVCCGKLKSNLLQSSVKQSEIEIVTLIGNAAAFPIN